MKKLPLLAMLLLPFTAWAEPHVIHPSDPSSGPAGPMMHRNTDMGMAPSPFTSALTDPAAPAPISEDELLPAGPQELPVTLPSMQKAAPARATNNIHP